MKIRIAAAQIKVTDDKKKNTDKIISFISKARKNKIDVVCFPETALCYHHENPCDIKEDVKKISEQCKKNKINVIFSSYVRENGKTYNRAFLINSSGKIQATYNKANLWGKERKYITPGKKPAMTKINGVKIGMITCFDFAFPGFVAKLKNAHVIFCPSFMIDYNGREDVIEAFPVMRAFENMAYFVMCDAVHSRTCSTSIIASPFSKEKTLDRKEDLIFHDIDTKKIDLLKRKFNKT